MLGAKRGWGSSQQISLAPSTLVVHRFVCRILSLQPQVGLIYEYKGASTNYFALK